MNISQYGKHEYPRPYDLPEEQFILVAEVYKNFKSIFPIVDKIFCIGASELTGGEKYPGYISSQFLNELLAFAKKTEIELPAVEPFRKYAFGVVTNDLDDPAYGTPFYGKKELSIYFK